MATNFPNSVDNFSNPSGTDSLNSPSHSSQHADANDAIEAIETYILEDYQPSYRNLIINGAMQVAQRGTSVTGITSQGYNTVDRFETVLTSLGTWTQTVENDAPTGSGFRKSLKMLCTTADSSPAAADILFIRQSIEGQNLQAIKKGTANAEQLTISFWVKSNVTGTYILSLLDADNTRQISATYTVSTSATWEKKTITFPADTTGAFDNDNAASLRVDFWLGTGSDFGGGTLNTSWNSNVNANRAVGQTNLASATNNYWQITGVQLEVGAVATPFEFKPIQQELDECYRYYQPLRGLTGVASITTKVFLIGNCSVSMRATPSAATLTAAKEISDIYTANFTQSSANITLNPATTSEYATLELGNFTGLTSGRFYMEAAAGIVYLSAEL